MMVPFGSSLRVRSVIASVAVALLLASGCEQAEESGQPKTPTNTAPRAGQSEASKNISNVEKDLHKDLAPPTVIKPDVPTTTVPPADKPDADKTGQP
jgi:hypothetical protein